MSKTRTLFGVTAVLVVVLVAGAFAKQSEPKPFTVSCVLFDHKDNEEVLRGQVTAEQFDKWFKKNYPVGGERIETPKNAATFGALVLTDGDDILVMPLYTWGNARQKYYACQSHEIGRAPMFSVVEESDKAFFQKMKAKLNEIGKAEQKNAPDKK